MLEIKEEPQHFLLCFRLASLCLQDILDVEVLLPCFEGVPHATTIKAREIRKSNGMLLAEACIDVQGNVRDLCLVN